MFLWMRRGRLHSAFMMESENGPAESVARSITGYHLDAQEDWVAELACGHFQHVRHHPPQMDRAWVTQEAGRAAHLGTLLPCKKCVLGAPKDE